MCRGLALFLLLSALTLFPFPRRRGGGAALSPDDGHVGWGRGLVLAAEAEAVAPADGAAAAVSAPGPDVDDVGSEKALGAEPQDASASESARANGPKKEEGKRQIPKWWKEGMPPFEMPEELREAFTLNGRVDASEHFYVDDSGGGRGTDYGTDNEEVQVMVMHMTSGRLGTAPRAPRLVWLFKALAAHPVNGLKVAVFGSTDPTAEAVLLAHGAAAVTTVEYNRRNYDHPQLSQVLLRDLQGASAQFDAAVSLSSFDHDGLGRYGDPVNPRGDLDAMATVRRLLRPRGLLYLSVPIGPDAVVWNLLRRYGPVRLPLLLDGWEVVSRFGWDERRLTAPAPVRRSFEPLQVLRPTPEDVPPEKSGDRDRTEL